MPSPLSRLSRRTLSAARRWSLSPWFLIASGLAALIIGALLVMRPFASLGALIVLLAVGMFVNALRVDPGDGRLEWIERTAWVIGGVLVLTLPALTIGLLTLCLVGALLLGGAVRVIQAVVARRAGWISELLFGVAWIVFGVVAAMWPDASVFVLAAVFGVQVILFGCEQLARAIRVLRGDSSARERGRFGRLAVGVAAVVTCALSFGLLWGSLKLVGTPVPDDFYAAPADMPAAPGELIRSEPFTTDIPAGASGWRILYSTTAGDGSVTVASAIVTAPTGVSGAPVVAWAHGTTGYAEGCAPSLLAHPFEAGAMPNLDAALAQGWAIVATDYQGLGTAGPHGYLVGETEGWAVLDAVRAAQQLSDAHLGTQTAIWGHSQGGHAALWAGGLATTYAPELNIVGVAALAPASDLPALLSGLTQTKVGNIFGAFLITSYAEIYPDVKIGDFVRPGGRILVSEASTRCLTDPGTLVSIATALFGDQTVWAGDPVHGALLERASENTPTLPVAAPLLIAQGEADDLVLPEVQAAYVASGCAAGQVLEYRTYAGLDHMGVVGANSPLPAELMAWTADRFSTSPELHTCT